MRLSNHLNLCALLRKSCGNSRLKNLYLRCRQVHLIAITKPFLKKKQCWLIQSGSQRQQSYKPISSRKQSNAANQPQRLIIIHSNRWMDSLTYNIRKCHWGSQITSGVSTSLVTLTFRHPPNTKLRAESFRKQSLDEPSFKLYSHSAHFAPSAFTETFTSISLWQFHTFANNTIQSD